MTDIKGAQGLEIFTVPDWYLSDCRKNPRDKDVVLLSDAQAVIDQLRAEINEPEWDAIVTKLENENQQLRERVAELELELSSRLMDAEELAALKAQAPVATVTIQHFRQDPSMENLEFQLQAPIPQGTHKLYASPVAKQKVVMPDRRAQALAGVSLFDLGHAKGWNACLDEVERLNRSKT